MKTFFRVKTALVALTVMTIAFTSCQKDKENKPDNAGLLTEKNWKLSAFTIDPAIDWFGNGTLVTNIYAQLPACAKDDLTIFNKNGVVNFDEGASKCDPNDPQTTTGTWAFNTDKTIISVTTDGSTQSWKVLELKGDRMMIEYQEVEDGITYTLTGTFAKQ